MSTTTTSGSVGAMTVNADLSAILPDPDTVTLSSGTVVAIRKLATRETFALLRIITAGLGTQAGMLGQLNPDDDNDQFVRQLLLMMAVALPQAEDEAIAFIRLMVRPAGAVGGKPSKAKAEADKQAKQALDAELDNPGLEDLLTIVEAIIRREAGDLQALGKRLAGYLSLAQRSGQIPASLTSRG